MKKRRISKKIKSNRGTSIFFGLLLFLVASILSIVMLDAAVTAVKRVESDRQSEQSFLYCSSAAKTLRDAIVNTTVTRTRTTIKSATAGKETVTDTWKYTPAENDGVSFGVYLQNWVEAMEQGGTNSEELLQKSLVIQAPSSAATQDNTGEVSAEFTIQANADNSAAKATSSEKSYDILAVLSSGEENDTCNMTLRLKGQVKSSSTTQRNKTITVTDFTWIAQNIIYGTEDLSGEDVK